MSTLNVFGYLLHCFIESGDQETRYGKLYNLEKFDASYFDIPEEQADAMDPQLKLLLELTAEAMVDAGE